MRNTIGGLLKRVRESQSLIHHITNWVTIYDCANITRAFGALPVMAHAPEEAGDMARISSALVLNIGTLTTGIVEAMIIAGSAANQKGIPVILDAVGVGATPMRNEKAALLLDTLSISIIKGNASEIAKLSGEEATTRGVEATDVAGDLIAIAQSLAKKRNCTVVITGKVDIVADCTKMYEVHNGNALMGSVVGTGCMAASVIGCFAAVESDYALASAAALACFGIASELAGSASHGPGSFKVALYDEVFNLDSRTVERMVNVETSSLA